MKILLIIVLTILGLILFGILLSYCVIWYRIIKVAFRVKKFEIDKLFKKFSQKFLEKEK